MKVIPPVTITDAMLTSSTVAEPAAGETAWVSGTSYGVNDVVIRTTTHRKYQCAVAVSGTTPPEADLTHWVDIGPTNKWAMFDTLRNSATSSTTGTLTVVLALSTRINSVALVGLVGASATITLTSSAGPTYTKTLDLTGRNTVNWSDFFYSTFGQQRTVVQFDLPRYATGTLTVSITGSGTVSCGAMVIGTAVDIGTTQYGASSLAMNFSTISRDAYGNAKVIQRRTLPATTQTLVAPRANVDAIRDVRELLNAVPAVWSGLDDATDNYFEALLILGIYKEFTIKMGNYNQVDITLNLEEI